MIAIMIVIVIVWLDNDVHKYIIIAGIISSQHCNFLLELQ